MKIVGSDNHNRETVADTLWIDGVPNTPECVSFAKRICHKLNEKLGDEPGTFYSVVEDNYRLWGGMKEFV